MVGEEVSRSFVAQMSVVAINALLEMYGVFARHQHVAVVVGFYNQIVGLRDMRLYGGCDLAQVGEKAEHFAVYLDVVAYIVGSVVGHLECGDMEIFQVYRFIFLDIAYIDGRQLLGDTVTLLDAFVH